MAKMQTAESVTAAGNGKAEQSPAMGAEKSPAELIEDMLGAGEEPAADAEENTDESGDAEGVEAEGEESGAGDSEESEVESEDEAQPSEEAKQEDDKSPRVPDWVQKKIDKLTAQKSEERAKVEALEAKLSELEAKISGAKESKQSEQADADDELMQAERCLEWARQNRHGGIIKQADGTEKEISAEQVEEFRDKWMEKKIELKRQAADEAGKREAHFQNVSRKTAELFPFVNDKDSEAAKEFGKAMSLFKTNKHLQKALPNFEYMVAAALYGQMQRGRELQAAASKQKQASAPNKTAQAPVKKVVPVVNKSNGSGNAGARKTALEMIEERLK